MNPLDQPGPDRPVPSASRSQLQFSPYRVFTRAEWAKLRADTPMTLVPRDLEQLSGLIEELAMAEVEQFYLPLSACSISMSQVHRSCTPSPHASSAAGPTPSPT